jgi:hypothetical protein
MHTPQDVREAVRNLDPRLKQEMQIVALTFAVRAMLAAHPNREAVQGYFHQMLAQMQAASAMLGDAESKNAQLVLRHFSESLFDELPASPGAPSA